MKKLWAFFLLVTLQQTASAQLWGGGVDDEDYHFGFTFQYLSSEFKIVKNKNWRDPFFDSSGNQLTDQLNAIYAQPSAGFGIGFVFNQRLTKYIDVRLTPSLVFNDRIVKYEYATGTFSMPDVLITKTIQSTIAEFPLGIKLKSDRRNNFRAYLLAGGKYSIDIASKKKFDDAGSADIEKFLKTKKNYLSYEAGIGFDLYFENFKLSPEAKLSYSAKDVMKHDPTPYATPIDKMMLRHLTFSLFIE